MNNKLETDCMELKESAESHAEWLHNWLIKHPNAVKANAVTSRVVIVAALIVAALIVAVSIIVAAFICRSGGERFKSFGNYRVLDTHTGKVHEVE